MLRGFVCLYRAVAVYVEVLQLVIKKLLWILLPLSAVVMSGLYLALRGDGETIGAGDHTSPGLPPDETR